MEKKWEFDKEYFKKILNDLNYALKHDKLSKQDKKQLHQEIFFFKNALKGNFWKSEIEKIPNIPLETLKEIVLSKMKKEYLLLGDNFINWVLNDCDNLFSPITLKNADISKSIDEMMEETLVLYKKYSSLYYENAKFIYEYHSPLIQEVTSASNNSFCIFSDFLQLPFLVIVKKEGPHILTHEIQHSIENMLDMNTPYFYKELGPTLFETMLLDSLYPNEKKISYYYKDRIEETIFHIDVFQEYFSVLEELNEKNFKVSMKEFIKIFEDKYYNDNLSIRKFKENIQYDILDSNIDLYICYFLSFLKSIELREQIYNDKKHGMELLENCLNNPSATFSFTNNTIDYYQRYCKEIYEKQKILIKK